MPVWSTAPPGDPTAVAHRMHEDFHGRPTLPICGRTSHGLYLRAWTDWDRVPLERRCGPCDVPPPTARP